jgi:acetyl esterase/lipase
MSKYNIHSNFNKYENTKLPLSPLLLPLINALMASSVKRVKPAAGLSVQKRRVPGYHNGMVELSIYEPKDIGTGAPCLIYLHGGAFVLKAAPYHKNLVCEYALQTPCKVVFVDYRLAPKYAFPVGVEDCYAAFEWVAKNAMALGIDSNRIAIGGDSAGAALAAAVSLMARDRKASGICFQMLIYPVTDARQTTESIRDYVDTPMWNSKLNEKMWKLYLRKGTPISREYASPMEATSLENMPDSYVEVSEFDCLRDEGIDFAQALKRNGVQVELYRTKGTVHGYDIAEKSEIVHESVAKRIDALKRAFSVDHDH